MERGRFIEPALTAQADAAAVLMSVRTTPSTNCGRESEGYSSDWQFVNEKISVCILCKYDD